MQSFHILLLRTIIGFPTIFTLGKVSKLPLLSLHQMVAIFATMASVCQAQNTITSMLPENGAVDVNIDTHLILTMSEETVICQKGFVSVYDKSTGKLVDRASQRTFPCAIPLCANLTLFMMRNSLDGIPTANGS